MPVEKVELHKHASLDEAIRASLANVGIELIDYKNCVVHPPTDDRRLRRFYVT